MATIDEGANAALSGSEVNHRLVDEINITVHLISEKALSNISRSPGNVAVRVIVSRDPQAFARGGEELEELIWKA